jgi:hypothetical protein
MLEMLFGPSSHRRGPDDSDSRSSGHYDLDFWDWRLPVLTPSKLLPAGEIVEFVHPPGHFGLEMTRFSEAVERSEDRGRTRAHRPDALPRPWQGTRDRLADQVLLLHLMRLLGIVC